MSTIIARHNILKITNDARQYAQDHAITQNPHLTPPLIQKALSNEILPIIKSQSKAVDGFVEVGFSSHIIIDNMRLRAQSVVPIDGIVDVITPFDVTNLVTYCKYPKIKHGLQKLITTAHECGLDIGFFGSLALELVTGLPYTRPSSDIDVVVKIAQPTADLSKFYAHATNTAQDLNTNIDIELLCKDDNSGIKLAELVSAQKTVLCKGLYNVEILSKDDLAFL